MAPKTFALWLLLVLAGPEIGRAAGPAPGEADSWRGRYCTPLGCRGGSGASATTAAGFGAAVLAAGLIGRRRDARRALRLPPAT